MARKATLMTSAATVDGTEHMPAGSFVRVNPANLHVQTGYNVRAAFNAATDTDDAELLASIRAHGVREPLKVRNVAGRLYIVAGHRRFAAVQAINGTGNAIKAVPAVIVTEDDDRDLTLDLLTSNQYKPLNPAEKGGVFLRLRKYGWDDAEIAEKAGLSERAVKDFIKLASADKRIKEWIKAGMISATLALEVVKTSGPSAPAVIAEAIANAPKDGAKAGKATEANVIDAQQKAGTPLIPARTSGGVAAGGKPHASAAGKAGTPGTKAGSPPAARQPAPASTTGAVAHNSLLRGPFRVSGKDGAASDAGDEIRDKHNALVAYGNSAGLARAVCEWLNVAWNLTEEGKKHAETEAAVTAHKAASDAAIVAASNAADVANKVAREAAKSAPAPVAPVAPEPAPAVTPRKAAKAVKAAKAGRRVDTGTMPPPARKPGRTGAGARH